jgi:hypothetical protein
LLALKLYAVSSRVVLQCRDSLQELVLSNRVRLVWVLGHCSIHGNEKADALARAESSYAFVGPEPCLPLAPSSVKRRERKWLLKSHCTSWSLETAWRQSRMWLKKPNPGFTRYLLRLPRSKLRILVGLITGHCPLNKHLHNMGLTDESICNASQMKDESAFHLLCDCPSLISLRIRIFSKPILGVEEYEGGVCICTTAICSGKWQIHCDSLVRSF